MNCVLDIESLRDKGTSPLPNKFKIVVLHTSVFITCQLPCLKAPVCRELINDLPVHAGLKVTLKYIIFNILKFKKYIDLTY